MAQEPKKRHSKASKRTRRASIFLESVGIIRCENCGEPKLPHIACKKCGFYKGKKVVEKTKALVTKA